MMKSWNIAIALLVAVLVIGYLLFRPVVEEQEIDRIASPDSLVEAVVSLGGAGATTSEVYRLYIVALGHPVPLGSGSEVLRADRVEGLGAVWVEPQVLEIRYHRARVFHFTNFWMAREVRDFRHEVQLDLARRSEQ
jgi:hypothetical protein